MYDLVSVARRLLELLLLAWVGLILGLGIAARLAPAVDRELLTIRSGSMEPAVPVGALIVVEVGAPPHVGQIVTYRVPSGTAITHRVTRVVDRDGGRYVETKGDANPKPDPVLVADQAVVGIVRSAIPALGILLAMLAMPTGIVAILCVTGTLVITLWLLDDLLLYGTRVRAPAARPAIGATSGLGHAETHGRGQSSTASRRGSTD